MQPLSISIRPSHTKHQAHIILYADDSNLVLTDFDQAKTGFHLSELCGMASGPCTNKDKSHEFWLGSWKGKTYKPIPIQWSSENKVWNKSRNRQMYRRIYNTISPNVHKSIDNLKTRNLSLITKPLISQIYSCSYYSTYLFQFLAGNWKNGILLRSIGPLSLCRNHPFRKILLRTIQIPHLSIKTVSKLLSYILIICNYSEPDLNNYLLEANK